MVNILDLLKGQLGSAAIGQIAELIGENNSNTSSAISSILPSLLGGLIQKGATKDGAAGVLDFLTKENHDGSMFNNLAGLLGGGSKTSTLMNIGSMALPFILGGKKAGIMSLLGKATGLGGSSNSTLMNLLAPMVLGMIGKQVKSSNLNAGGLMDMLLGQKEHVQSALPDGMGDLLGFAKEATKNATNANTTIQRETTPKPSGGGGLLKYIFPILLLLGGAWFVMNNGCGADGTNTVNNHVETTTETVETATKVMNDAVTYTEDASGNLVDGSGNIVKKAGEFTKEAGGKIMDASGNAIESISTKSSEIVREGEDEMEKKETDMMDDGSKAKSNAVEKTADFFSGKFGGMFKKGAGATSVYTISKMEFNPEDHRISYFSKPEFEGLAAALKANPDSKISVQVYTDDGASTKANKKLTRMRAEQIESMLETLGVGKKQVSSKGMGSEDATKAGTDAIEIVVE